jgi:uncharacterized protein YggT (Ycf19 family)
VALLLHTLTALKVLVVADALFSWFLTPGTPPRSWTGALLDPLYAPLRRLLQPLLGSIDLSPLIALLLLHLCALALSRMTARGDREPD